MAYTLPYTFSAGTLAASAQVNANFNTLLGAANTIPNSGAGTLAGRPAASSVPSGSFYWASDDRGGMLFQSNGSAWVETSVAEARGSSIISATEARTSTSYGTLTTPDQVTGLILPSAGLLSVVYQATWQESVAQAGRAAIFLNGNQMTAHPGNVAGAGAQEAVTGSLDSANTDSLLTTFSLGLISPAKGAIAYTGDVANGQAIGILATQAGSGTVGVNVGGTRYTIPQSAGQGGACLIKAAAGTYTISVQFKSTSGSVTVKNRNLYVRAIPFS